MTRLSMILLSACLVVGGLPTVHAEVKSTKSDPKNEKLRITEMVVSPARAPVPALKYRLVPGFLEQTKENAAPLYMKALLAINEHKASSDVWDKIHDWIDVAKTPLEKLPKEEVRKTVGQFTSALRYVDIASRRSYCDWASPLREEENIFATLLPELQQSRQVARLLALRARLQIAEGKYEDAVATLRTGYALARHVGDNPFLVSDLVGLAIGSTMNGPLEELMASPGSPNLYWAITALPQPMVDLRKALDVEGASVYLLFPEARDFRHASHSPERWQALLDSVIAKVKGLTEDGGDPSGSWKKELESLAIKGYLLTKVPAARQRLTARGWPEKEVAAMPAAQVILVDSFETYDEHREELYKWFYVPYPQAAEGTRQTEEYLKTTGKKQEIVPLASLLLPALSACQFAEARAERQYAALRAIEAIRLYAAVHDGRLPLKLDDIREVPVPVNPVTGKAFPYRVEGETAILEGDGPKDKQRIEYRIRIAKR